MVSWTVPGTYLSEGDGGVVSGLVDGLKEVDTSNFDWCGVSDFVFTRGFRHIGIFGWDREGWVEAAGGVLATVCPPVFREGL